ncbi:MAG: hypothetical protein A3I61_18880 [Acidobacteria bacterium RIFCSPLOWO2_02_FULL_68_18]|nr:MAG: hypothetical protein A3I61_18880 [Acidobacteria bacterium RIFCSPLOWO2_02_FULL_68_18]OFW48107.1 MAG: hypothetical protein A3G77_11490 [Acidobacteria bacterium RIFCSPLOWO2_12_FULL_68_19]
MDLPAVTPKDQDVTRRTSIAILVWLAAVPAAAQQAPAPPAAPPASYTIGAGDALTISSYDQESLSGRFVVEADGTFTFPLLGRVTAGGLTLLQFEGMLRRELIERGFFKNPQIAVTVDRYSSRKIYVLGEVRKPGVYSLSGAMRLIEALALADSTLPTAARQVIVIPSGEIPSAAGNDLVVRVSLDGLESGDIQQNVQLRDGDTILVRRAEDIYVFGEVRNPGAYPLRQEDTTVLQALSMAGGVTDRGATGRIEIVRMVDGERREIRADLTDEVLPGDTVVVPQRFF